MQLDAVSGCLHNRRIVRVPGLGCRRDGSELLSGKTPGKL